MARTAQSLLYFDPFSGISGDMLLGALLDLGLELPRLDSELAKLNVHGYQLAAQRVMRGKLSGTKFDVLIDEPHEHEGHHHHDHRTFADIRKMIEGSALSARVKSDAVKVFQKLADAEGRIHNLPAEQVAFHEVGAIDSIVDVVGACIGLEALQVEQVWCGPLALGSGGFVKCAHGLLPVPAPATLELVKGLPLRQTPVEKELTTPTGAALVATLATQFGPLPAMVIHRIGYGAGGRDDPSPPNVLRALLGTSAAPADSESADTVTEIQCNIDDATPETLGYLAEALLSAGALDVFCTPVVMKKSRPATLLTVLAEPQELDKFAGILFSEGSTFGLRYRSQSRLKLSRRMVSVTTPFGDVRVKVGSWLGREVSVHPEFDDCRARAQERGVPLKEVIEAARAAYRNPH